MSKATPRWRKSTYSGGGNNCVELAPIEGTVAIRDSKRPHAGIIQVTAAQWSQVTGYIKRTADLPI